MLASFRLSLNASLFSQLLPDLPLTYSLLSTLSRDEFLLATNTIVASARRLFLVRPFHSRAILHPSLHDGVAICSSYGVSPYVPIAQLTVQSDWAEKTHLLGKIGWFLPHDKYTCGTELKNGYWTSGD